MYKTGHIIMTQKFNNNGITQFYLPPTHEPYTCLRSPAVRRHRPLAGTHCAYPRRDGQAELTWEASYIKR